MQVYKFGGASVRDAEGIKNVVDVLRQTGYKDMLIVVSAMGKTTNALESIIESYFKSSDHLSLEIQEVIKYHNEVLLDLFENDHHPIFGQIRTVFEGMHAFLKRNKSPRYSFVYDQVVSSGELASTKIINAYFNHVGIPSEWLDARVCLKTDANYRDANLEWELTKDQIQAHIKPDLLQVTQGFIASDENNFTTTLGREGSDYTAAIFAFCLNAHSVTIWKDVPGVMNADPRRFQNTELLYQVSYREAIELAFYGASVIHPKTLQPLQRKEIPLHVKSFLAPLAKGTTVSKGAQINPKIPCFIVKNELSLIRLSSLDFSFMVEENISEVFKILHEHKMKVGLIQNSAISFSVCIHDKFNRMDQFLHAVKAKFNVVHTPKVSLYTIRHFNEDSANELLNKYELLLEQRTKDTLQLVMI